MTKTTTTPAVAPELSADTADLMWELTGFHPALDRVVAAIGELLVTPLTAEDTRNVTAAVGAIEDTNVIGLLGLVVRDLADPALNPALRTLSPEDQDRTRAAGARFAAHLESTLPTESAGQIGCVIDGV